MIRILWIFGLLGALWPATRIAARDPRRATMQDRHLQIGATGGASRMVKAADSDGSWSDTQPAPGLNSKPRWYRTGPFRWLPVAVLGAIVWGVRRLRMIEVRKRRAAVMNERDRLARVMHDTLAQDLNSVAFQLDAVVMEYREIPAALKQRLDQSSKMIRGSLAEAYRAIHDLRAPVVETRDLASAISDVVSRAAAGVELDVRMRVNGSAPCLNADVENNLLRIVREAVANVVKHARARTLDVEIECAGSRLTVTIRDDGRGFDTRAAFSAAAGHYGLLGMRERADEIGARLRLESGDAGGTEVLVELPRNVGSRKE
ncbi:MAG: sensor histidine kinase [Vicinamibacteria bacterium]|nr:sensor histidine kinase [Vicinamibacteria bacterium]